MRKIASPDELASELRSLLAYASGSRTADENPSRERIATRLRELAAGLVTATLHWEESNEGVHVTHVRHASGEKSIWAIFRAGWKGGSELWGLTVKTTDGAFDRKRKFGSLEIAQRFVVRLAKKPQGYELLKGILDSDFKHLSYDPLRSERLASGLRVAGDRESRDLAHFAESVFRKAERDREALDDQLADLDSRIVVWKIWGTFLDPDDPEAESEEWEGSFEVFPDGEGGGNYEVQIKGLHHSESRISQGSRPDAIVKDMAKAGYDVDSWDLQTG